MSEVRGSRSGDRSVGEMVQEQKQANAAGAEYMKGCTETIGKGASQVGQGQRRPQGEQPTSPAAGQTATPRPQ